MSWNVPHPYFTFSIPFQIYRSTAFINSGGSWEISSLPCNHACGTCCCSSLGTNSTDIKGHTRKCTRMNSTSREIKTVWKISFLTPASLSKPLRALLKQHLHSWMTKQAVRLSATPPDQEATRRVPQWTSQAQIQLLCQGRRAKTHLYLLLCGFTWSHFSSLPGRKTSEKFLPPSFSPPFFSGTRLRIWVWLVQDEASQSSLASQAPIIQEQEKSQSSSAARRGDCWMSHIHHCYCDHKHVPFCILIFNLL